MPQHPNPLLTTALTAALETGRAIMDIYQFDDFEIELKEDQSPLTKADQLAHKIIAAHLGTTGIPILSEEGRDIPYEERKDWPRLWIVDPIDGTKEFIKRNGEFTVNIALVEQHKPVLGVIYAPALNVLYFGSQGQGAYKLFVEPHNTALPLDKLLKQAQRLPLEQPDRPFTVVASRSHRSTETDIYIGQLEAQHRGLERVSIGSSLKLCLLAEGKADCYPRFAPTMEWDTAAGQAICQAVGLEVTEWVSSRSMPYNRRDLVNPWFVVQK